MKGANHDIANLRCPLFGFPRPETDLYAEMAWLYGNDPEYQKTHIDPAAIDWSKCTCKESPHDSPTP